MIFKKKKDKKTDKELAQSREQVAKALEILFADGYIDRKKLYLENFIRGMVFSAGTIIGATIVVAFLLWTLSLFDEIPLIGPLLESISETIENGTSSR